jgi:uncharacterized protein (DUF2336 family)
MSVVALRNQLTDEDVRRLVRGDNEDERAIAAQKICRRIDSAKLTTAERDAAQAILNLIARDAAEMVRRAMAVTLKSSPNLPHEIAVQLAQDIDAVATPILVSSPVLTDEDLLTVLETTTTTKRCAIASRENVSAIIVHEILDSGDEKAVRISAANDGADYDAAAFQRTMTTFGDSPDVMDAFVARSHLPLDVTEKLISHISDVALDRMMKRHALPPQLAVEISEGARERATVDLVDQAGLAHNPKHFVQQLRMNGRLTPSLVLRATLRGHMVFLEHALAELAGVSHGKAWLLIHDAGPLGLRAIYDRTGMPPRIFPAIRAALEIFQNVEMPHDAAGRARFQRVLAERALTRFQGIPEDDLDYILSRFEDESATIELAC